MRSAIVLISRIIDSEVSGQMSGFGDSAGLSEGGVLPLEFLIESLIQKPLARSLDYEVQAAELDRTICPQRTPGTLQKPLRITKKTKKIKDHLKKAIKNHCK